MIEMALIFACTYINRKVHRQILKVNTYIKKLDIFSLEGYI